MLEAIRRTLLRSLVDARSRFRRRRWDLFLELCRPDSRELLLDVGGQPDDVFATFWAGPVIRVNRQRFRPRRRGDRAVVADARALPFRDGAFSVLFCNSVLEHVGPWEDQRQAANEMQRVGERYFVQVPDRHTPIEPHYLLPFFQYLSESSQRTVHKWLPIGGVPRDGFYRVWLLTANQLRRLFPDARVVRERVLGFPKSCYAVRGFHNGVLVRE